MTQVSGWKGTGGLGNPAPGHLSTIHPGGHCPPLQMTPAPGTAGIVRPLSFLMSKGTEIWSSKFSLYCLPRP